MTPIIHLSTIRNFLDTNPVAVTATWEGFIDRCCHPVVRGRLPLEQYLAADKDIRDRQKDGAAIIAGSFSRPGTRNQDALESLSLVTLDFDNSPFTFDELCEKLDCFECVVFTSYSHSAATPKYRAYLPLSVLVTGQIKPILGRICDYFAESIGYLDECCRKPNQLYYSAACPLEAEHLFQCRHISGVLLDPADFPEIDAPRPRSTAPTIPPRTATSDKPGDLFNARADWKDLLEPLGWHHCYRNHWTRPSKKFGVSASILEGGLYIHSSDPATAPFICGKCYSPFGAYALIYHGGDHSAAARELRRLSMPQAA